MQIYFGVKLGGTSITLVRVLVLYILLAIPISINTHRSMVKSLLKAPVNLFYDVTPSGRVLNRLSRDQNTVDDSILSTMSFLLLTCCSLTGVIVLNSLYFPYIALLVPPLSYFAYKSA